MIELAFTICLYLNADHCEERSLLYADESLMTCMMAGQAQLAAWATENPRWKVTGWRCRIHDPSRAEL